MVLYILLSCSRTQERRSNKYSYRFMFPLHPALTLTGPHICGPLAIYVKLLIAHAPGMPGTFSPPPWVSDPDMHRDMCVTHVLWCIPESLTRGFLWSRGRGKRSWHSRHMRNLQFYVSGKRPMHSSSSFKTPILAPCSIRPPHSPPCYQSQKFLNFLPTPTHIPHTTQNEFTQKAGNNVFTCHIFHLKCAIDILLSSLACS